jgi:hypothetical protein
MLVVAAGWGAQHLRISQAQEELTAAEAESRPLTAETLSLAPVATFVAEVAAQKAAVQATMTQEIYFSSVLNALQAATPSGARVESAIVALNPVVPPVPATATGAEADTSAAAPEVVAGEPSLCPGPDHYQRRRNRSDLHRLRRALPKGLQPQVRRPRHPLGRAPDMNLRSPAGTTFLGALALVVVAALGWLFVLGPAFGELDAVHTQTSDARAQQDVLNQQLTLLREQQQTLPRSVPTPLH